MNDRKKTVHVGTVVLETVKDHLGLSLTILAVVAGAVGAALVPPLVLGRIVDGLTAGEGLTLRLPLWYLAFTALAGGLESARESALTVFGQKTTHALRSRLMEKEGRLPADELNRQEPGALVSRFVGDVDTVETLFTAGIISMAADACRILSILIVVWQCSRGLAYLLLALLPALFLFTRFVQKRMLHNQLKNRKAVSRASGYVPETVRNLRTIRTLGKETYMETRYDGALGESYRAIEGTNFYDALYSPVILTVNAAVVGAVMLLSASGKPAVLTLFGMTAGTAVTVMNYISQIFSPLESLGMEIQTIQSAVAGVRRINDFLAQPEQETVAPETENPAAPMVELRDVDFGYEAGQNVLHHLNMEIREGELATLSGRTGARDAYAAYAGHIYFREGDHETGLDYIQSEVARHIAETGEKPVVLIDYLQIIAPVDVHFTDKQNLDRIVCALKKMSRQYELTVFAISSFNRENYNLEVSMNAFKESGGIDYSADVLLGLQARGAGRPGFQIDEEKRKDPRELELKILKNRSAALGQPISLRYYPAFSCFMEG